MGRPRGTLGTMVRLIGFVLLLAIACQTPQPVDGGGSSPGSSPAEGSLSPPGDDEPGSAQAEAPEGGKEEARAAIAEMIDDWHAAAAEADEERYLGHLAADAVFLGTDAGERWDREAFAEYVHTYFPRGGWTYLPHDRHISLSPSGDIAWFDEKLTSAGYGELRGTGVVRREEGRWLLCHYSMTFTVPNGISARVVALIRSWIEEQR